MTAGDVMTTAVKTVGPDATIWTALAIMRDGDIRHLPVVDDKIVGVLSNRDYRRVLERADGEGSVRGVFTIKVAEIMTPAARLTTGHRDTPLSNIAQLMTMKKVGCVPIVDAEHRLVGLITQKDVLQALVRQVFH